MGRRVETQNHEGQRFRKVHKNLCLVELRVTVKEDVCESEIDKVERFQSTNKEMNVRSKVFTQRQRPDNKRREAK